MGLSERAGHVSVWEGRREGSSPRWAGPALRPVRWHPPPGLSLHCLGTQSACLPEVLAAAVINCDSLGFFLHSCFCFRGTDLPAKRSPHPLSYTHKGI